MSVFTIRRAKCILEGVSNVNSEANELAAGNTLSCLIAVGESHPWLSSALDSVAAQSQGVLEILLILDGFKRSGLEVSLPRQARVLELSTQMGPAHARNLGLERARGSLIGVLDSDDTWHPEHVADHLEAFNSKSNLVLRGRNAVEIDENGRETGLVRKVPRQVTLSKLRVRNCFTHSSVVYRREAAQLLGGYNTSLKVGEDWELWLRLVQLGAASNTRVFPIGYRVHATQVSSSPMSSGERQLIRTTALGGCNFAPNNLRGGLLSRLLTHLAFGLRSIQAKSVRRREGFGTLLGKHLSR